jgi:hypothetical protein
MFQVVPYTQPEPRCRRSETGSSFEGFLLSGGGLRGVRLGAQVDEEAAPLLTEQRATEKLVAAANRQSRMTLCAVMTSIACSIIIFAALGVLLWRINSQMASVQATMAPHADKLVNTTVTMLEDLGGSFTNVRDISAATKELAKTNFGTSGPAGQAINHTAEITSRLAEFLASPTIQLSLGGNGRR